MDSFGYLTPFSQATYQRLLIDRVCVAYALRHAHKRKTKIIGRMPQRKKFVYPKVKRLTFDKFGNVVGGIHIPSKRHTRSF